jgi:hypothetical protein
LPADGKQVLQVHDGRYGHGMAGLLAARQGARLGMPYFDNVLLNRIGASRPAPASAAMYARRQ